MLKNFGILKVTEKNDLLKIVGACAERKFSNVLRFEKKIRFSKTKKIK